MPGAPDGPAPAGGPLGSSWRPHAPAVPRRTLWTIAAAVTIGVVVVVGLAASGAFKSGGSGGTTSSGLSSTQAMAIAHQETPTGTWYIESIGGLALANATTLAYNLTEYSDLNCSISFLKGGLISQLTLPAYTGSLTAGTANVWSFEEVDPTEGALVDTVIVNGAVVDAFELSQGVCAEAAASFEGATGSVISSSAAAGDLLDQGLSSFVAAHPTGLNLEMSFLNIEENDLGLAPQWGFSLSACSPISPGTSGPAESPSYSGTVNASDGAVTSSSTSTEDCSGSSGGSGSTTPIGSVLALGGSYEFTGPGSGGTIESQGCASGDACLEVTIVQASGVAPDDFGLEVESGSGALDFNISGYAVVNASGAVLAWYDGPFVSPAWSGSAAELAANLSALDSIVIDCGTAAPPSGTGYVLVAYGVSPFSGSIETSIP